MNVVISGATGFLGRALLLYLTGLGHTTVAVVRDPGRARALVGPQVECVAFADAEGVRRVVGSADAVVHLAGAPIAGRRWTARQKRELAASRITTAAALVSAMRARARPLPVFVSASAVGYYGDRDEELLTETAPRGDGFAAELCERWEQAALAASGAATRVAIARLGIVLGPDGGALPQLVRAARWACVRSMGGGAQWVPWIHIVDAIRALGRILADDTLHGPVNLVAPAPVRQRDLASAVAQAIGRPAFLPVPRPILRLALGEAASLLLASQRAYPYRLEHAGFRFSFPQLSDALDDLLRRRVEIRRLRGEQIPDEPYLARRRPRYVLAQRTTIDRPIDEVVPFFARADNLSILTPPSMGFSILTPQPIEMRAGATIDYRITVNGLPLPWRTRIERWEFDGFVDAQLRGPYRAWWHEHRFRDDGGRTMMDDVVLYAPPLGLLGRLANRWLVAPKLREIFSYRSHAIRLRFGGP